MPTLNIGRFNSFLLSTASFAALATPAFAQQPPADQPPPEALQTEQAVESGQADCNVPAGTPLPPGCTPPTSEGAITVTGTRIRRPNLDSPLPVTSVGGEEFFQTGNVSIGDKLAELPSIRTSFTQANSTRGLGISGLNLLDLRGLGILRTLVLVNGRRHVGGDVLLTGVVVDVNTIPTDLIERVDVVTGGNSAVYGSDAIAGVVNFVLKQDYDGILLRGQGGQSKYGDAGAYFLSALVGKNFAGGRGNFAVNFEYARRDQAWGSERDWFRQSYALGDSDPPDTPNGSDGDPDLIRNPDFRSATFNNTGNIRFGGPGTTLACGLDPQGNPYTCPFIFMPNGQLVPQTGTRIGLGPNGQFIGGNGEGFFEGHQIQITPQLDRYNVNALAHFEVSPALVPFVEAKYSRTDSVGTGASGPAFIAGGAAFADPFQFFGDYDRERISINNPFLSDQARQLIIDQRALAGLATTDATRLVVQESLLGLGNRTEEARRNTFRIVGGVRGDIGDNWNYEASLNYGQLKEKTKILSNLDVQRMLLAMDAVRDPATGNIVCRSQIDPTAAFGYYPWVYGVLFPGGPTPGDPNGAARLANDVAQCVPVNVLGGNFTQQQKDYLLLDTTATGKTEQFDALAFISGDTSKWFELPGGPIGIVLGAEYRTDNLHYQQNRDVELGYTFYNPIPTFSAPKSKVKEAFGEIRLPLFKDLPFLEQLEVAGAARVSDYNLGTTGTVWAYNGNVVWSPVKGLRFRGNYARAVRAPNQVELFTPFGQNFALVNDPCDVNLVGAGSEFRAANCLAAGIPAGTAINYTSSLPFLSGGNEDLEAETSDSITIGGVLTPAFLPGFSASVDYYDIKVKNVIQAVAAQQILDSCYDLPSLTNPFCALFQRSDATGTGAVGGVPFGIISNSLHSSPVNFAKLKTRGIDVELAYRRQLGSIGRLDTRLTWTHIFELTNFIDPTNPNFGDRILSELGDPQDKFNWNASLKHGRFTFGYQMRYIGKQITFDEARALGEYEDFFGFEGRDPQNQDLFAKRWVNARFYHDVRFAVDVGPKYNFYLGVDNLTNVKPPFAVTGLGAQSGLFDAIGRFFYAGVSAKF
jgi:outer membrane receptor protein involved in Fe transport